jgi:uncharacterized protein (DUF433 family)
MNDTHTYEHLEARPGSNYRQLFVKGKRIRAEVLYRQTIGLEPRTPEEVARDYDLPLDVVREAVDYCLHNPDTLQQDRDREWTSILAYQRDHPPLLPPDYRPDA